MNPLLHPLYAFAKKDPSLSHINVYILMLTENPTYQLASIIIATLGIALPDGTPEALYKQLKDGQIKWKRKINEQVKWETTI